MRPVIDCRSLFMLAAVALVVGCAPASDQGQVTSASPEAGTASSLLAIPNARIPIDGVLSGGQPTPEQIEAAARAGFRTVINLRADSEAGFEWERAAVERLGLRYVHIPVAGAEGLTRDNVEAVDRALRDALAAGPTLFHCGSGNRIGAMLALRRAWIEGEPPDHALAYGKAGGLTRLEPATRELLGLPPQKLEPAARAPGPTHPG